MTICEEIGGWAAGLEPGDLPPSVRERAVVEEKQRIAACGTRGRSSARLIRCWCSGARLGLGAAPFRTTTPERASGSSTSTAFRPPSV